MKYYVNYNTKRTLIDENENTPYLADRGYTQVSPAEYYRKNDEFIAEQELLHQNED